jgi:23S rRNA (adenine2503-C2)-methyltransferase
VDNPSPTPPGDRLSEEPEATGRRSLLALDPDDYPGQGYRKRQVANWIWVSGARSFAEMTNLPAGLREELATRWRIGEFERIESFPSEDGSVKFLYTLLDGARTEAVYMPYPDHTTLCISSQVGCPAGCTFCATGRLGFGRNLSAAEILDQVLAAAAAQGLPPRTIRNVVLMGMGEPLLNLDAVTEAARRLIDPRTLDLSPRRITLSTVGIPKGIHRLAEADLGVRLALSLHAPDDETRQRIIPTAHRFGIAEIMTAVHRYFEATRRRVTFEYTMLEEVNDHLWQARRLGGLLTGIVAHVNLIPFNTWPGAPVTGSPPARIRAFTAELETMGISTSVRWSRGQDVGAACGQLALTRPAAG